MLIPTCKYTYSQGLQLIKSGRSGKKKLDNNTYMSYNQAMDQIEIKLHGNTIISINKDNSFRASHCGWLTMTTKDRLNQYTNLGIYQRKGNWYTSDDMDFNSGATYLSLEGV